MEVTRINTAVHGAHGLNVSLNLAQAELRLVSEMAQLEDEIDSIFEALNEIRMERQFQDMVHDNPMPVSSEEVALSRGLVERTKTLIEMQNQMQRSATMREALGITC